MSDNLKPYAWIKKIPIAFKQLDSIPLLGNLPPFPWNDFEEALKKLLNVDQLSIESSEFRWLEENELEMGLGVSLSLFEISLSPLSGRMFFAISQNDLSRLIDQLLLKEGDLVPIDDQFQAAFHDFLALEIIHCVSQIGYAPHLTPNLVKENSLPSETMLAMDIAVKLDASKYLIRLLMNSALCQSFREHYIKEQATLPFQHPLNAQIDLTIHIEAGSTSLSQKQWEEVKPGDFLFLDHCSLNPGQNSGTVTLTLEGSPVLRGKIKDGNIEILENPIFHKD